MPRPSRVTIERKDRTSIRPILYNTTRLAPFRPLGPAPSPSGTQAREAEIGPSKSSGMVIASYRGPSRSATAPDDATGPKHPSHVKTHSNHVPRLREGTAGPARLSRPVGDLQMLWPQLPHRTPPPNPLPELSGGAPGSSRVSGASDRLPPLRTHVLGPIPQRFRAQVWGPATSHGRTCDPGRSARI
jgi:hypothetical protein